MHAHLLSFKVDGKYLVVWERYTFITHLCARFVSGHNKPTNKIGTVHIVSGRRPDRDLNPLMAAEPKE